MSRARKSWWIPMGSFALAVVLAQLAGPTARLYARRAADATGCTHDPYKIPGENIKVTTVDNVTTISQHPTFEEFDLNKAWALGFNDYLRNIVKSQDGSVTLNAHLSYGSFGGASRLVQMNEKNKATVGFTPNPPDCCHKGSHNAWGLLQGELRIIGVHPLTVPAGTFTIARVGIGAPAWMRARVEYDSNCNGVVDAQHDDVYVAALVFVEGNLASGPARGYKAGYVVTDTVYTVDGVESAAPRVTKNLNHPEWPGPLKLRTFYGPKFVGQQFRKSASFTDLKNAEVQVEARRNKPGLFTAGGYVDIMWDNTILDSRDSDEGKYVRLEKE